MARPAFAFHPRGMELVVVAFIWWTRKTAGRVVGHKRLKSSNRPSQRHGGGFSGASRWWLPGCHIYIYMYECVFRSPWVLWSGHWCSAIIMLEEVQSLMWSPNPNWIYDVCLMCGTHCMCSRKMEKIPSTLAMFRTCFCATPLYPFISNSRHSQVPPSYILHHDTSRLSTWCRVFGSSVRGTATTPTPEY